jgi:hypothetical protein
MFRATFSTDLPLEIHLPHITNSARTPHTEHNVPTVTGKNAAANAHQSSSENRERLPASTTIMPPAKQIAGITIIANTQTIGVPDQLLRKPPKHAQALTNHNPEQITIATEIAELEIRVREMPDNLLMHEWTVPVAFTHVPGIKAESPSCESRAEGPGKSTA